MEDEEDVVTQGAKAAAGGLGEIQYLQCAITAEGEPERRRSIRLIPKLASRVRLPGGWSRYRLVYKCFSMEPSTSGTSTTKSWPADIRERLMGALGTHQL